MTALEILNLLKSTRDKSCQAVVWLNEKRREAAVHPGGGEACCIPVDYNDARVAITDPALARIAQDAASEDYTHQQLAKYLDELNEALVGKDDAA